MVRQLGLFLIFVFVVLVDSPALPADHSPKRLKKIVNALSIWAANSGVQQYSMAIGYQGEVIHEASRRKNPEVPAPLASLSKAVTGACIVALENRKRLSQDDTLSKIWGAKSRFLSGNERAGAITVGQLLTHTSGLNPDITQGRMHNWKFARSNRTQKRALEALAANAMTGQSGTYFYNNGNYAVLGALIEHVTGQPYETACSEILPSVRSSPSLMLDKKWRALGAFGGWQANTRDYLNFILSEYGPDSESQSGSWDVPSTDIGGGARYGPGVLLRNNSKKGRNILHSGLLCFENKRDSLGSFFAVWGSRWSVAVTYNKCTNFKQLIALDSGLWKAAHK